MVSCFHHGPCSGWFCREKSQRCMFQLTQSESLSLHKGLQDSAGAGSPTTSWTPPLLCFPTADCAPGILVSLPHSPAPTHTACSPGRPFAPATPSASVHLSYISTWFTPSSPSEFYSSYLDVRSPWWSYLNLEPLPTLHPTSLALFFSVLLVTV